MQIEDILDEYRTGSAEKRLSMFLCYRELRDEFARIEQSDPADLFSAGFAKGHGRLRRLVRSLREKLPSMCPARSPGRAES